MNVFGTSSVFICYVKKKLYSKEQKKGLFLRAVNFSLFYYHLIVSLTLRKVIYPKK